MIGRPALSSKAFSYIILRYDEIFINEIVAQRSSVLKIYVSPKYSAGMYNPVV